MLISLAITALLMGLVGGPHCVAMCGAACAGIGRAAGHQSVAAMTLFQLGRLAGYSALGAVAAGSMQGLGWLTVQSAALRPLWSMLHVAAFALGLMLLWRAKQPLWLDHAGRRVWAQARALTGGLGAAAPLALGSMWALLPCGLLYSALLVAAMANSVWGGAGVMALFALGSGMTLMVGPWLWLRLRGQPNGPSAGVRLAGAALAASSAWALWMALVHNEAPWCVV